MENLKALQSTFLHYQINEEIPLYNGEATLVIKGQKVEVEVSLFLQWLPSPSIRFSGNIIASQFSIFNLKKALFGTKHKIILSEGTECQAQIYSFTSGNQNAIGGEVENFSSNEHKKVKYVEFTVVNFLDCLGRGIETDSKRYLGRLMFHFKGWKIIIDKRSDYNKKPERIMKQIKNKGGYLITHIGKIERTDETNFSTDEIAQLLDSIRWLLSFASGRHVGICLLRGKLDEESIWFNNTVSAISPWKNNLTWFPRLKAEVLEDLFPAVSEKFTNDYLKKVLCEALIWYIECNSSSIIENKIVSAQTVLEMLSWSYLVIHLRELSKTQFKKKTASDNIRALLKKFQIGLGYSSLPDVQNKNFDDGVHLLIAARNDVIHPLVNEDFNDNQKYKILQLALHYIELVLLGIFGFDKCYVNRLKTPIREGNYEIVPWVRTETG